MSFQIPNTTTASTGFSLTSTPTVAAAKPPSFSFGTNVGGGDADTVKPLGFGLGANTGTAPTTTTTGLGGGFFSLPTGVATTGATTTASTTTGAQPSVPAAPVAAPAPTFSFGAAPQAAPTAPAATTTTGTAVPTFGFGAAATAAPTTSAPTFNFSSNLTPASGAGNSLGIAKTTGTSLGLATSATTSTAGGFASLSTATKTTDSSATSNVAQISYNQLEEHINKWTLELEEQEKIFTEQATQTNAWDKILMSNNQKILELNDAVQKVKGDQQTLEQELEFIATQHKELEESILPLQKEFQTIPQVDVERSQTYLLVENLDTQLKQMSEDLKEIIDNLNESNKSQNVNDPIVQIGKILNAHMTSLQWIEAQTANMAEKLGGIEKLHESFKRDTERSFRSAYLL